MPSSEYIILSTQPLTYVDAGGALVNGYRVVFRMVEFNEIHHIQVPSLDPQIVKREITTLITQRKALSSL